MKISEIIEVLFPLRSALMQEIEYLKSQLAQERRRVDVLQEALVATKRPALFVPSAKVNPTTKPKPVGWEATRAEIRNEPETISARPDAGSESQDADQRLEA